MAVRLVDAHVVAVASPSFAEIAGEAPGIVTLDNVPGRAIVDLLRRGDRAWLRREYSRDDGTYRFRGVAAGVEHDLIGIDLSGTWDDVIVGRVLPFMPLQISGNAPAGTAGAPYAFSYLIAGGAGPYSVSLSGALPSGLTIAVAGGVATISGTLASDAVDSEWVITVTDSRGGVATLSDDMHIYPEGSHRYWRMRATAANNYCAVAEMEMAAVAGGANLCTGGEAITGGHYPNVSGYTFDAQNAFDGSLGSVVNSWISDVSASGWVGYVFSEPVAIAEVRICPRYEGGTLQSPRDFVFEFSDTGATWTAAASFTGETSWAPSTFKSFAI